ncbi:LacI family DNA-binding transcriptional regulator [Amycolatopsis rhizosphaerae]|uniref:LacI family DNA-binding transcriptional regulator n=1 Tax=Amycolatopsis rhizosphaerae TaxID=2053003 RepID=UPI001C93C70C|nr:LacI family DNA-binding transcriptional regulator [Amycolatopsis rhizosphaerae]
MTTPTVYDVADRAGVSIATVSRVYRNPDSVKAKTRERVLAVARELGYVPSGSARGLASRSTGVLGLCFPDYTDPETETAAGDDDDAQVLYADQVIRGMERAARRHGYALLISASLQGGAEQLIGGMAGQVDGFAVLARTVSTEDLDVYSRRLPVVMLAGPREIDRLDHVEVANFDGQRELTRHLVEVHGLTRLAFVGGPEDSPDAEARFQGYQAACRDAGLPAGDEPDLRRAMTRADGREAVQQLAFRPGGLPQGLLFANDQMAVGAMEELISRGVRIPTDVAVTGFDGIPLGRMVRPSLTTVRQPMRRLGETAVELLLRRLADRDRAPESVMLPVSLALRASCGCGDAE